MATIVWSIGSSSLMAHDAQDVNVTSGGAPGCDIRPVELRCEYLVDPLALKTDRPRLSWVVESTSSRLRGATQTAYEILVADSAEALDRDEGTMWKTGKVTSNETLHIEYGGRPLNPSGRAHWKVRVWDAEDRVSAWSKPATFALGPQTMVDWGASWIADSVKVPAPIPAHNGYHSELTPSADVPTWVMIDLNEPRRIDGVRLFPARPYDWKSDVPGLLFPVRFRVETALLPDFSDAETVVDRTGEDVPNPGEQPLTYTFERRSARYVRLWVTRRGMRDPGNYAVALAEMEVFVGENNLARGAPVMAESSIENGAWSKANLTDGNQKSHGPLGYEPLPATMLRREFRLSAPVTRAVVYASALGAFELRINGQRVGENLLAPEWTDYHRVVQYQAYDVTHLLREGDNAIGVLLGDGWYAGRIGLSFIVPNGPIRAIYGRQPRFLLRLEASLSDDIRSVIVSDASWRASHEGPIRSSDILDGEEFDARRVMPGWDRPGFNDASWPRALILPPPQSGPSPTARVNVVAQPNEPIRVVEELKPIAITQPSPGVYVFDFGQNMAGFCRLRTRGPAGSTVTLRHAEVLDPEGNIFTANLRTAAQTDRFTLAGAMDADEVFEPHFTYHGFRYVEVTGLSHPPTTDTLLARAFCSSAREVGRFECSDPMVTKLVRNILWTQRANLQGVPTDCPQRDERLGWMGDILSFCQAACFNMDMAAFYTKWIPDVRDAQTKDGRYPDFAPHPFDPEVRFSGTPAWGDAGVVVPWCAYVNYADRRLLEEHFESARRWVDYIRVNNPDLIWHKGRGNQYGDWLTADTFRIEGFPKGKADTPQDVFATAFFAHSTQLLANMAEAIGRKEDAKKYGALAADIRAAFNQAFVKSDGRIEGDTQGGYAIALNFDLLPDDVAAKAVEHMIAGFEPYRGHLSTGFHSTRCLMLELTRRGHVDHAYRLLTNRTMPSWGYLIDRGATTIWERWDGYVEGRGFQDAGMNSFSHYSFGSVAEWIYRTILGINPDPKAPGYRHILLRPVPGGGLTWARGSYDSIRGRISSAWKIEGDQWMLEVSIPANTTATLELPTGDVASVMETGRPADQAPGVRRGAGRPGIVELELASGTYSFTAKAPPARK